MNRTQRDWLAAAALSGAGAIAGACGGGGARDDAEPLTSADPSGSETLQVEAGPSGEPAPGGSSGTAAPQRGATLAGPAAPIEVPLGERGGDEPRSTVRSGPFSSGSGTAGPDGRPAWWFSDIRSQDGRLHACAEALGHDLRSARRDAIEAARRRLIDSGATVADERIDLTWAAPLGAAKGGGARYTAYVQLSVLANE